MSLNNISALEIAPEEMTQMRRLLNGKLTPEAFPSVASWIRECYHRPSYPELVLRACNEILGGFGVEGIRGEWVDDFHWDTQASYVNMGDSYAITVIRDHVRQKWLVSSVGDLVEWYPKRFA